MAKVSSLFVLAVDAALVVDPPQRFLIAASDFESLVLHSRRARVEGHCLEQSLRQSFALLSEGLVQGRARVELKSWHT